MSKRAIDRVRQAPRSKRIGGRCNPRHTKLIGFETVSEAKRQDMLRVKGLQQAIDHFPEQIDVSAARALKAKLTVQEGRPPSTSLASFRHMRRLRRRLAGHLWHLSNRTRERVTRIDLLPEKHRVAAADIHLVDPRAFLNALRSSLNRLGAKDADGWLYAFLHGEYDPLTNEWDIHYHLLVAGGMIDVVKRLRKTRHYKSPLRRPNSKKALPRVKVRGKPLENLPKPALYCMQSWWPMRNYLDEDGQPQRGPRRRIPEPHHSNLLLWLDQWRLADLTLLMKLRVTRSGITVFRR